MSKDACPRANVARANLEVTLQRAHLNTTTGPRRSRRFNSERQELLAGAETLWIASAEAA